MVVCLICGKSLVELQMNHFTGKPCRLVQNKNNLIIESLDDYQEHFGVDPRNPESIRKRIKDLWKKRRANDPDNDFVKKTWSERRMRYGPSGGNQNSWDKRRIDDPDNEWAVKAWNVRRERHGPNGYSFTPEEMYEIYSRATKKGAETKLGLYGNMRVKDEDAFKLSIKQVWDSYSPEEKMHRLKNGLLKSGKRPNGEEISLMVTLEELGFYFNQKPLFTIEQFIPDFLLADSPFIIEYDGGGNHNPKSPFTPDTWEEIWERDGRRDACYRRHGYYILSIYPEDLELGRDFIIDKVNLWMLSCF